MKLIGHVHGKDAYQATVGLLRSKGIPTHIKYSGVPSNWPVPYRAAIDVCLDQHYDDALALLKNPTHPVASPVDVEHFERSTKGSTNISAHLEMAVDCFGSCGGIVRRRACCRATAGQGRLTLAH